MKNLVVINEQHKLLPQQQELLTELYGEDGWERFNIPFEGVTAGEMETWIPFLVENNPIFASPIPLLIGLVAEKKHGLGFAVLYNDHREKKELPNGKIIMTVAQTGWQLKQF